jgi:hypothetical protein
MACNLAVRVEVRYVATPVVVRLLPMAADPS